MGKRSRGANNTSAVMAQKRAKGDNEGLTDEQRLWKQLDFYPTPPWAGRAGAEVARDLFPGARVVREPACGEMHLAGPLGEYFEEVLPSDVHAHSPNTPVRDWLDDGAWPDEPDCDLIMTNPPFEIAAEFVRRGLPRARLGVGLLVRTVWIESADRYPLFEGPAPLTQLCPFSERVGMVLGKWDPAAGSATSYSWLFWAKGRDPMPPRWISPGTRDRLWKPDDAMRYGFKEPLPLFPEGTMADFYRDDFDVI